MDLGPAGVLSASGGSDAYIAKLAGATGVPLCGARYGDEAGSQQASSVAISRFAAGADKDSIFVSGVFASEIDFRIPGKTPLLSPPTSLGSSQNLLFFLRINHP
jgi:hypothetical protein